MYIIIYNAVLALGFVLALPWFLWKGRATGKYLRHWGVPGISDEMGDSSGRPLCP